MGLALSPGISYYFTINFVIFAVELYSKMFHYIETLVRASLIYDISPASSSQHSRVYVLLTLIKCFYSSENITFNNFY